MLCIAHVLCGIRFPDASGYTRLMKTAKFPMVCCIVFSLDLGVRENTLSTQNLVGVLSSYSTILRYWVGFEDRTIAEQKS